MADDDKTATETRETAAGAGTTEPVAEPHPLAEGGVRFNEVVAEKNQFKARVDALEREVAQVRADERARVTAQAPPPEKVWSAQELQGLIDAGRISPVQAADQVAYQRSKELEASLTRRLEATRISDSAQQEVDAFLRRKPEALDDPKVLAAGRDVMRETGWGPNDPRVAKRALREVYGSPEKIQTVTQAEGFSRRHAETHVEAGGGGGLQPQNPKDPLAHVHQDWKDYWAKQGYSQAQMVKLSKYVTKPFPGYIERIHGVKKAG